MSDVADRIDRGHPAGYFVLGDALRGIACAVVVIYHATLLPAVRFDSNQFVHDFAFVVLRLGSPTVYVFFALSGYLVGGPWVRSWLGDRPPPKVPKYLVRRARRILPAFWLILAFRLLDKGAGEYGLSDAQALGSFLGIQTFYGADHQALMSQGWTVNVELFFYLVVPVLFLTAAQLPGLATAERETRRRALIGFLAAWSVAGIALRTQTEPDGPVGHSVLALGWAFAPGMVAAAYETELKALLPTRQALGRACGLGLIAAALAAEALVVAFQIDDGKLSSELAHLMCGAGFVGGALIYEWSGVRIPRALDNPVVHAMGRWSYGVYLLHLTVGQKLLQYGPDDLGPLKLLAYLNIGMLFGTALIAAAMWRYWEEPWLDGFLPWRRPAPKDEAQPAVVTR
ncbi:O-acetyltransferase [Paraconexibacter sp. AEG42_29]|uniref:O-acetyltransferase n=1 Tax=Paraconexibacter sp. AEG42_29 TaxID=2997339 RepID=A0AAU7B050_9ACTN